MRPLSVAGIQMTVRHEADNASNAIQRIRRVVDRYPWVDLVMLSELAVSGMRTNDAVTLPGEQEDRFREVAAELGIWLLPGSMYERCEGHVYNTASMIDPHGEVIGRYRKMFPFLPYEAGVSAGSEPFVFDIPDVGRCGVAICYDIWFPEHARWLVSLGAEVILLPSLTDTIDREIEMSIVQATAAQNQCYIVNVNGLADGGNGRSLVVGPAGDIVYSAATEEQDIPLELHLDRVSRGRERGLRGLGQPLKSFRDRAFEFPQYAPGARSAYFDSLGPLEVAPPRRGRPGTNPTSGDSE